MSSVSTANRTVNQQLVGRLAAGSQGGALVRKLVSGQRLTAIQRELAAATGLTAAVADLVKASQGAPQAQGLLAGAKASADIALKTRSVLNKAREADSVYADSYKGYAKASNAYKASSVGRLSAKATPAQDKFFSVASDVATVAGLGLSALALPNAAKKTATSFNELTTVIHDPNASVDTRLDKAEAFARAGAGTVFSAQGVVLGVKGTTQILSRTRTIGAVVEKAAGSKLLRIVSSPFGKVFNALLPVADGAVFIGELIATRRTFKSAESTPGQRLRQALNMGLAGLKVAFWIFPQVRLLRSIYSAASLGQLAFTLWDLKNTLKPTAIKVAKAIGWGVTHPVQAIKAIGTAIANGVKTVANATVSAARWVWDKLSHPAETAASARREVGTWFKALSKDTVDGFAHLFGAGVPAQPKTQLAPAAVTGAPTEQVAYEAAAAQIDAQLKA